MHMTLRQVEGGYYIKLTGRGRGSEEWVTEDKKKVVSLVRREFLGELTPKDWEEMEKGMKKVNEAEKKYGAKKKGGSK